MYDFCRTSFPLNFNVDAIFVLFDGDPCGRRRSWRSQTVNDVFDFIASDWRDAGFASTNHAMQAPMPSNFELQALVPGNREVRLVQVQAIYGTRFAAQ